MKKLLLLGIVLVIFILAYWNIAQRKKIYVEPPLRNTLYVINVLEKEDYEDCHIKNSISVTMDDLNEFLRNINRNAILVFYCANYFCTSSDEAALRAKENNFSDVYVYRGGMSEWYQKSKEDKSYEYEGPALKTYLNFVIAPKNPIDSKEESAVNVIREISAENLLDLIIKNQSIGG